MKAIAATSPFLKFLASGAFNTAVTYAAYLALLQVLPYRWSYTISYLLGIALAYALYRYVVFGRSGGRYGPLWVVLIYLLQYLIGLGLVSFWVQALEAPPLWAPAFAISVSVPLSYAMNRWVFKGAKHTPDTETAST
jgi:putative flippase GtrA